MATLNLKACVAAQLCSNAVQKDRSNHVAAAAASRTAFFSGQERLTAKVVNGVATARSASANAVIVVAAAGNDGLPALNDLPMYSYINQQGRIVPPIEPGTQATVFAVLDKNKKVQYVGFSKDIRNSLRTLMGRRPEFCYYFKLFHLVDMDQQKMLDIRSQVWCRQITSDGK